jgi:replicative DNA helicase
MDKLSSKQDAEKFLKNLGLRVDEADVRSVICGLREGLPLYDFYAHGRRKDGRNRTPLCGKGTAYKIKNLYERGELEPYVDYLSDSESPQQSSSSPHSLDESVPTGFLDLDRLLAVGMRRSDLLILAGRSGVGKSTLAMNVTVNVAKAGFSVYLLSLETTQQQLATSIVASEANIDPYRLSLGLISESEAPRLDKVIDTLPRSIYIEDRWSPNIEEIRSNLLSFSQEHPLDLVIVDYMELLESGAGHGNVVETTDRIARNLKAMARELNLPVLVLSQLNEIKRPSHFRRPQLSDLPNAAGVVPHADVVMFLDQDALSDEEERGDDKYPAQPYQGVVSIIVAKNRHGARGVAHLRFNEGLLSFENLALAHPSLGR